MLATRRVSRDEVAVAALSRREQPALALAPSAPVTTLRFAGRDAPPLELPATQERFTIGATDCDLLVPRDLSTAISANHATIDRVGPALLVRDLDSRNGSFSSLAGPRRPSFHIHPGDRFWLANVAVLATDFRLEALRAHLACHLGLLCDRAIDDALTTIAAGHPLLLMGPSGTGARRLARVIHATSPRRGTPLLDGLPPLCLLHHAHASTVFIDVDETRTLPARETAALFDPSLGIRVIFAARDDRRARSVLDHYRDRVRPLNLTPLADRLDDVPHLLQFHWATELDTAHSVTALGPRALRSLTSHNWPRNLDELYEHSPRILAYHRHTSLRRAAAALGITHQTLSGHLARIGFPVTRQTGCTPL